MKEYDKTPEEDLSEMEISNLPAKVSKMMIIKMFKDSGENGMNEGSS